MTTPKSVAGLLAISAIAFLGGYAARQISSGRTEKDALQKKINFLEKMIAGIAELTERKEELITLRDKLKDEKDSVSEMSEMDMFHLQQLTQMSSQLEEMISNVLKAISQTQSAIVDNLKA